MTFLTPPYFPFYFSSLHFYILPLFVPYCLTQILSNKYIMQVIQHKALAHAYTHSELSTVFIGYGC